MLAEAYQKLSIDEARTRYQHALYEGSLRLYSAMAGPRTAVTAMSSFNVARDLYALAEEAAYQKYPREVYAEKRN